jgi:Tfp pilus assembly protein PilF
MSTCISTERITSEAVPNAQAIADCLAHVARAGPQDANAVQVYEWALKLDPCNIESLNELGRCLLAAKKYEEAFDCFETAADIAPDNAFVCINAALAAHHRGLLRPAHYWLDKALFRDPSSTLAYHQRFNLCVEEGDTTGAAEATAAGLAIDPTDHDLLFGRACLRLQAGKYASGWKDYEHRPTKLQLAASLDEWGGN